MAVDNTHFKGCWRPEEDEALRKAVGLHGEKNWSVVARHFNTLMGRPALLGRAPKQCRSRYLQQLVPGIKTGEWSPQEEEVLVEGHKQFGNQWTLIASMLPGRTETSVKNHYNCTARRKVPSDLSRMTILQRYLASIGVISLNNTRGSKFPALGSGYPSSSSSQFFHNHGQTPAARNASKGAARSAPISPSASHQYEEYPEEEEDDQQQQEYEQQLAFQQQQAAEYEDDAYQQQQQYAQYPSSYERHTAGYTEQQPPGADNVEEGAADGLLALARAALLHMEGEEHEEEEEHEAAGSHALKQEADDADLQEDAACKLQQAQQQLKHLRQQPISSKPRTTAQLGSSSPAALWAKPELLPVVRSNSEESDHTAEEEEGSPMAEANLKLQLQQALHPSSSLAGSKRSPHGHSSMPGISKRHRPMWEQIGSDPAAAAAGMSHQRLHRPVLDVSEPSYGVGGSAASEQTCPVSPGMLLGPMGCPPAGPPAPATPDAHTQLLALMMQAFMGAAAAEGSPSAAALSSTHLAALARVMQLSGLSGAAAAATPAAAASQSAVVQELAAMVQGATAAGSGALAAWSSTLEQQVQAAAGQ